MRFLFYTILIALCTLNASAQIIINEISYNSPESGNDSLEYIELYNAGNTHMEITGWYFTSGIVDTMPVVHLAPGDYYVTAVSASAMLNVFNINVHEWFDGALSNGGETIVLVDASGTFVDSVAYGDSDPWPTGADGMGPSLELKDPSLDNDDPLNWQISGGSTGIVINGNEVRGTPGRPNSSGGTAGPAVTVDVAHLEFDPPHVVVQMGDSVRWVNNESIPHNVNGQKSVYPDNSENFFSGAPAIGPWQFDYQFNNAGLNDYQCDVHVISGMRGTVAVYNPDGTTQFELDHVRLTDGTNGQHIFDGASITVEGTVHGINFLPTGYSFYIINEQNIGINVFSFDPGTYTVNEGDVIEVRGVIDQFNGLLEIVPEEINVLASGNSLVNPQSVVELSEEVEGSHVVLTGYSIDSIVTTGTTGFNVFVTHPVGGNILIRVDSDTGIDQAFVEQADGVRGIGTQFDPTFPFTSGYQLQALEFFILPGFPTLKQDAISMTPNPASDGIDLTGDIELRHIEIYSIDGKRMLTVQGSGKHNSIDISSLHQGLYIVKATADQAIWSSLLSVAQ